MKKIISTLFLTLVLTAIATSTLAQTPGQIPIVGRADSAPNKITTTTIITASEPKNEIPFEISNYIWTFVNVLRPFTF